MLYEGAFFAFEDHAIWRKGFNGMPHTLGDVHPILTLFRAQHIVLNDRAIIVMGGYTYLTTKNHESYTFPNTYVTKNLGASKGKT